MLKRWMALLGVVALLAACAHPVNEQYVQEPWNGGTWNTVLGYLGPYNTMDRSPAGGR